MTTCNCVSTHGTCQADCTIVCDTGFADCNGNVADGCESSLTDPVTCGTCDNDCTGCNGGDATCNAGTCGGTPLPNGSACRPSTFCVGAGAGGVCISGQCLCADGIDMSGLPPAFNGRDGGVGHPTDIPCDCSFTGGGNASALVILLFGIIVLLTRRRASNK